LPTSLETVLMDLVGPAASILIEESFEETQSRPGSPAREDVLSLFAAIRKELSGEDRAHFDTWSSSVLSGRLIS